ncbi:SusC/RagA family TonB-linked outer membrane protein [Flavobacterium lacus]|uniref:TonB-linked SusC/RagA family outer membrane protein n=1 Tax=Flavobacterium lacus TaxID=1353778 RepID=A0A328WUK7_9FLAO|nr:SusC/RagA family TonB-linked outer membrane protein [Flavobacterium lacus]RAR47534.1 TonB-linked SusC/RagA family outer membrane protein [Flavobacterium lacus]
MKTNFRWIFTLLLALFMQLSFAQQKTVSGTITEGGMPLPGVTVILKGTSTGTQSDMNGKYSISAKQGDVLEFSYIGLKTQSVKVGASSSVNVVMEADVTSLSEVVVEGYRTTSKAKSNIASTTVSAKAIEGRPNASFIQTLQAQVPGLNISTGSGSPGSANTTIILRGVGSVNGNIEPLFVIDGVPANQVNFRSINPNDIESVSVLKDAAATSIYGNRGANGVIVVKTKRGVFDSKLSVRYSVISGFTTLQEHKYNLMNSKQLLQLQNDFGSGLGSTLSEQEIAAWEIDTDWEDVFFQTGISQDHNISFTSGSKNLNSYVSLGYFEQEGIVPGTQIKRFTFRNNFSGKSDNDKFNYSANINANYSKRNQLDQETRGDINGNVLQNPLQGMLSSVPYLDPNVYVSGQQLFDQFGGPSFQIVPYMLMDYLRPGNITSEINELKLLAQASGSYKLTKDLTFSSLGGIDMTENTRLFARNPQSYLAIAATPPGAQFGGLVTESNDRDFSFNLTNRLNYNKIFKDKHTFDLSLMTEYFKAHRKFMTYSQTGLDPRTSSPGAGTGYIPFNPATPTLYRPTVGAFKSQAGLFSYFSTVDYDYDSKYGFGASIRRDASYRFTDDYKWGTFWSVSGRWNINKEKFMEGSIFDELKLRASYGTAGNQNISGPSIYAGSAVIRSLYGSGSGYGNQPGLFPLTPANRDARWETVGQANIGIDFVINKRFRGSLDVYEKKTIDLYQDIVLSPINGVSSLAGNLGDLKNSGVEALLAYDLFKTNDFNLTLNFNGSYNKNEFTFIPAEGGFVNVGDLQINEIGGQVNQYFNIRYAGVNPANGNLLFLDANGAVTENPTSADRVSSGKGPIPVYQGGFGFDASYKGFYVTTQFSFVKDVWRYDFDLSSLTDPNGIANFPQTVDMANYWTPENPVTSVPALNATNLALDALSDRWLRDASYLRLRFASIGYNVPAKFLDKTFMSSLRIYGQAENFLTWSKWRGFDPESNAASTFGGYPTPKIVSFGLDLEF